MRFRWLSCMLFLFILIPLTAQETGKNQVEYDYQNFRETFKEVFASPDSSLPANKIAIHPVQLPDWLARIPDSHENSLYAIGISDPGMMFEEAIELATLRAKAITALLYKPKISSITDNYSNELNKGSADKFFTKYVNYYRLFAALSVEQENFQLIEQFFNSFNEAIVLLKYTPNVHAIASVDSLMVKIDIYQAERQQSNRFEFEEKFEMYGLTKQNNKEEDIDIFYYFFRSVNQFYEIVSRYNGIELEFPQSLFRYQSLIYEEPIISEGNISYKLTNGLWKAYLLSLLQNFAFSFEERNLEIARVGDNYSSSTQNLSRELVIASPNLRIGGFQINNNRLTVILKRSGFKR